MSASRLRVGNYEPRLLSEVAIVLPRVVRDTCDLEDLTRELWHHYPDGDLAGVLPDYGTSGARPESVRFEQTLTGAVLEATNRALRGNAAWVWQRATEDDGFCVTLPNHSWEHSEWAHLVTVTPPPA